MTHRDRAGDPPGRREAAGDAGHRQGFPTPSGGSPARPERRLPKAFGRCRARLPMSRIATPRAPGRKPWEAVSMGHYQRSLVLGAGGRRGRRYREPGSASSRATCRRGPGPSTESHPNLMALGFGHLRAAPRAAVDRRTPPRVLCLAFKRVRGSRGIRLQL